MVISKSPISNSFNAAATDTPNETEALKPLASTGTQKPSVPTLQYNPPETKKAIDTQMALDKAASLRLQQQSVQSKKAVISVKTDFAKAKIKSEVSCVFNKKALSKEKNQIDQQGQSVPSLKQDFAKEKAKDQAAQDFNKVSKIR